jgi:hypothetical protein
MPGNFTYSLMCSNNVPVFFYYNRSVKFYMLHTYFIINNVDLM